MARDEDAKGCPIVVKQQRRGDHFALRFVSSWILYDYRIYVDAKPREEVCTEEPPSGWRSKLETGWFVAVTRRPRLERRFQNRVGAILNPPELDSDQRDN